MIQRKFIRGLDPGGFIYAAFAIDVFARRIVVLCARCFSR